MKDSVFLNNWLFTDILVPIAIIFLFIHTLLWILIKINKKLWATNELEFD